MVAPAVAAGGAVKADDTTRETIAQFMFDAESKAVAEILRSTAIQPDKTGIVESHLAGWWEFRSSIEVFSDATDIQREDAYARADALLARLSDGVLIGGSEFELQQRVAPLARALLEAGMDIDTLLERMMGLV